MKNVLEYLEHSAREFQDKVAVDDGMTAYTYSQLHELARKIGSAIAERIKPGTPVPVVMDKSADTLAVYLGVVEAGCFYVPADMNQAQIFPAPAQIFQNDAYSIASEDFFLFEKTLYGSHSVLTIRTGMRSLSRGRFWTTAQR